LFQRVLGSSWHLWRTFMYHKCSALEDHNKTICKVWLRGSFLDSRSTLLSPTMYWFEMQYPRVPMKLVPVSPLPAIQYVEMKSSIQREWQEPVRRKKKQQGLSMYVKDSTYWFPTIWVKASCNFSVENGKGTRFTDYCSPCLPDSSCCLIYIISANSNLWNKTNWFNEDIISLIFIIQVANQKKSNNPTSENPEYICYVSTCPHLQNMGLTTVQKDHILVFN